MSTIKERKDELENFETSQLITSALRDISALQLHAIKKEFEKGQSYYKEIENLYRLIKTFTEKRGISTKEHNHSFGGTLFVAVTSNRRLYGILNKETMRVFQEQMDKDRASSYYVIGQIGRRYIEGTPYEARCKFFEFKQDDSTAYENIIFVDTTRRFENVFIFYPKFINVFKQEITLRDIAYVPKPQKKEVEKIDYLFEPELGEIFWFFETQVRYILFNQILLEVKLARIAARLLSLNMAEGHILESIKKKKQLLAKAVNTFVNMRLLETFAGITQWNKNL